MSEPFDLKELLERNPQVDRELLEEAEALQRRLAELGVERKGYGILPPAGGRRVTVRDDAQSDPRVVRLRRAPAVRY